MNTIIENIHTKLASVNATNISIKAIEGEINKIMKLKCADTSLFKLEMMLKVISNECKTLTDIKKQVKFIQLNPSTENTKLSISVFNPNSVPIPTPTQTIIVNQTQHNLIQEINGELNEMSNFRNRPKKTNKWNRNDDIDYLIEIYTIMYNKICINNLEAFISTKFICEILGELKIEKVKNLEIIRKIDKYQEQIDILQAELLNLKFSNQASQERLETGNNELCQRQTSSYKKESIDNKFNDNSLCHFINMYVTMKELSFLHNYKENSLIKRQEEYKLELSIIKLEIQKHALTEDNIQIKTNVIKLQQIKETISQNTIERININRVGEVNHEKIDSIKELIDLKLTNYYLTNISHFVLDECMVCYDNKKLYSLYKCSHSVCKDCFIKIDGKSCCHTPNVCPVCRSNKKLTKHYSSTYMLELLGIN